MKKKRILFINGSINSGKSTIAQMLAVKLQNGVYIEGDQVVSRDYLTIQSWLVSTIMNATLLACEFVKDGKIPIVAFPLRDIDWQLIQRLCGYREITPYCFTLDPGYEKAISKREDRELTESEAMRVHQMYTEGYNRRLFSSLILQNEFETPEQTCERIIRFLDAEEKLKKADEVDPLFSNSESG